MDGMNEEKPKLPRAVFERTITLLLAGFGLVAALAWNDAIQSLFAEVFGAQGSLIAKFGYAILVTVIVTIVSFRLGRKDTSEHGERG
ncbi:MAG: hypothetical protein A3B37_02180 [Candidatus Sungbacteria bacterium RIFCSPLOWO2_01_FULL_59_16]|uniref:Uncharacterized protein n=1 Tax=Candidatus Sungbacteria bacterium RIFCSPLOWO2_01_FULL_59_16 TaxID=1802280 RepID=A0A1G2LCZ4_9BACT|nr:MAG: hypothetical protein A3B37_02180 [Candidatus Sungbacteria bacterium RIFCSPLOWO2_01_FULL_59_16]